MLRDAIGRGITCLREYVSEGVGAIIEKIDRVDLKSLLSGLCARERALVTSKCRCEGP